MVVTEEPTRAGPRRNWQCVVSQKSKPVWTVRAASRKDREATAWAMKVVFAVCFAAYSVTIAARELRIGTNPLKFIARAFYLMTCSAKIAFP